MLSHISQWIQLLEEHLSSFMGRPSLSQLSLYLVVSRIAPVKLVDSILTALKHRFSARSRLTLQAAAKWAPVTLSVMLLFLFTSCYTTFKTLQRGEDHTAGEMTTIEEPESVPEYDQYDPDFQEDFLPETELSYRPSRLVINNYYFGYGDYIRVVKYRVVYPYRPIIPFYDDMPYYAGFWYTNWYPVWVYWPPASGIWAEIIIGPVLPPPGPIYCPPPVVIAPPISPPVVIAPAPVQPAPGHHVSDPPHVGPRPFPKREVRVPGLANGNRGNTGRRSEIGRRSSLPHDQDSGSGRRGKRGSGHRKTKITPGNGNSGGNHHRRPIRGRNPQPVQLVSSRNTQPPATIDPPRRKTPVAPPVRQKVHTTQTAKYEKSQRSRSTASQSKSGSRSVRSRTQRKSSTSNRIQEVFTAIHRTAGKISRAIPNVERSSSRSTGRQSSRSNSRGHSSHKSSGKHRSGSRNHRSVSR